MRSWGHRGPSRALAVAACALRRWPRLHRWNGRLFLGISLFGALSACISPDPGLATRNGKQCVDHHQRPVDPRLRQLPPGAALQTRFPRHRRNMRCGPSCWSTESGSCASASCSPAWCWSARNRDRLPGKWFFVGVSFASWALPLAMLELYPGRTLATPRLGTRWPMTLRAAGAGDAGGRGRHRRFHVAAGTRAGGAPS